MKTWYNSMDMRLVGIIILYTLSVIAAPSTEPSKVQKSDYAFKKITQGIPIRVLLQDGALNEVAWDIYSDEGFILYIPTTKEKSVIKGTKLMVTQSRGSLYLNGKKLADNQVYIMPIRGLIRLGTVAYDGIFSLTKTKEVAYLVNHLDLEEYLMSVLRYESMPGWPDEVQKAFCVAIRSYAIFKVMEQREQRAKLKQTYPYDIKNTNAHQVYRGHEKDTCYKKIVEATRDIVLAYKGKPILAMFDIACGGIVPGKKKGIHFDKAPYLKRMYACNYCNEHPCYRWETTLSFRELESGLKKLIPNLGSFRDMKIESHDDAGVVHHIRVRGSGGWFTITAAQLRSTFKSLRSLCFSFVKRVRSVTVRGKGHGHHMGLCQWGACSLVKKGWSYKKVLQYYYPDTTFMKLTRVT